jgi:hypothetical protein
MVPYTGLVQRFVAIMAGFAFVGATADVSALHTHAYTDHEHAGHRHGPAAHEHPQVPAHEPAHQDEDHDAAHVESCDPGQHAVAFTIFCPPLPRVDAFDDVPFAKTGILESLVLLRSASTPTDVRVHGPPLLTQTPPRAPPSIFPA